MGEIARRTWKDMKINAVQEIERHEKLQDNIEILTALTQ